MTDPEVIEEGEAVEIVDAHEPRHLPAVRTQNAVVLADNPKQFVERSSEIAAALMDVVESKRLYTVIQGKKHLGVEAWTLLGSMMGAFGNTVIPVTEWSRPIKSADGTTLGWEARVEARTPEGAVVGAAEAMCMRTENRWKSADEYAVRSMAQTRATSKALRQPLGFIVQLAGYEATPASEMPQTGDGTAVAAGPGESQQAGGGNAEPAAAPARLLASAGAVTALRKLIEKLPDEWTEETILEGARTHYNRPIDDLSKLYQDEIAEIGKAAKAALGGVQGEQSTPNEAQAVVMEPKPITEAQKKKANILVGKLREAGKLTTAEVFDFLQARYLTEDERDALPEGALDSEGGLHFGPIRDTLTRDEAKVLIDWLTEREQA